ncbi:MAG: MCP four helix bundle domain-containing protein, partial [Lachnoclostridium sp.]|nr:MCP four helix bundle domain-containing protein [Lachnoclostridium sp.]
MNSMFKNLKIGKKLTRAFTIIIAFFVVSVAVSIVGVFLITSELQYFYDTPYKNVQAAIMYRRDVQSAMRHVLMAATTTHEENVAGYLETVNADLEDQAIQREILETNSSATELIERINAGTEELAAGRQKVMDLIEAGDREAAAEACFTDFIPSSESLIAALTEMGSYQNERADEAYKTANTLGITIGAIVVAIAVFSLFLTLYFARFLTKMMVPPMEELRDVADKMSNGDLNVFVTYESKDEFGMLANSLKKLTALFKIIIPDIENYLDEIGNGNLVHLTKNESSYIGEFELILKALRKIKMNLNNV